MPTKTKEKSATDRLREYESRQTENQKRRAAAEETRQSATRSVIAGEGDRSKLERTIQDAEAVIRLADQVEAEIDRQIEAARKDVAKDEIAGKVAELESLAEDVAVTGKAAIAAFEKLVAVRSKFADAHRAYSAAKNDIVNATAAIDPEAAAKEYTQRVHHVERLLPAAVQIPFSIAAFDNIVGDLRADGETARSGRTKLQRLNELIGGAS